MTIDLAPGVGGTRLAQEGQATLAPIRRSPEPKLQPLGRGDRDHGQVRSYGSVGRFLSPRESDMAARTKGRQLIGSAPAEGRSAFTLSFSGSTEGLAEHQPKKVEREPSLWQSGSGKDGGELKASEFAESRVRSLAITKCYTTETGERAKAYERAQRGRPTPGPGEYDAKTYMGETSSAVKLAEETRGFKTDLDWTILRASALPSAQEYGAYHDPRLAPPAGGNFNTGNSKSEVDWIVYSKKDVPGPGTYKPMAEMDAARAGKAVGGALTSSVKEPQYVTEARRLQGQPGPGAYDDGAAYKKCVDSPSGGGRISVAKVATFTEAVQRLAKQTPGIGTYNLRGEEMELPQGGRFGLEQPMDTLELSINHLKGNPGCAHAATPSATARS